MSAPTPYTSPAAKTALDARAGRRGSRAAAALLTVMLMANVDVAVVNIAAPSIQQSLHATGALLQLMISGYVLVFAVLLVPGARLGHLYGIRRTFLVGVAAFTIASLACGLAVAPWMLLAARVAQGAGAALAVPQVLAGIHGLPDSVRRGALGAYVAVLSGSAVLGQTAGGLLISADLAGLGWRTVFLLNVPIGALAFALGRRHLARDESGSGARLDLRGAGILAIGLTLLTLPLILGEQLGWPIWTLASLAVSLPVLALFVGSQLATARSGRQPLLTLAVLRRRAVSPALLSYSFSVGSYFALLFVVAVYLQDGLGHSAAYSGAMLIGWVAAFGVAGLLLRRLNDAAVRRAAPWASLIMAAALALVAALAVAGHADGWPLFAALTLGGLGLGALNTAVLAILTGSVETSHSADLSGLINVTSQVFNLVGVATAGTLYLALGGISPSAAPAAFAATAAVLAGVMLIGAVFAAVAARTAVDG
ncbi:MFS transporter [Humibacter ginsenosidimutans]|uniref:MFS transporter n=1 Tax=Humibacter ginsenosidimutans TaxID=2599293 RepID=A0A5B8M4U7_9MICO|nr:MFS transporter [Humibacter ginsenosidimutans]QDZ15617.1 MFS transporter [Humibacter ginsenosidimutans]